ncbi:MAG: DUF1460 domain-containing protein [Syntrophales bacterium]|nr:DUF1460 domain-containing protein [Syntrophales bacterium]
MKRNLRLHGEFDRLIKKLLPSGRALSAGGRVAAAACALLGRPYRADVLEEGGPERLIVQWKAFDCVTLVETAVALAATAIAARPDFACFTSRLRTVRYRKGRIGGYASRLHYFTDWLADNEAKKILRDRTRELGGVPCRKRIDWMSAHRDRYPALADPGTFRSIRSAERRLSAGSWHFLEKEQLRRAEGAIREGDIVAIASAEEGLDVCHVGIAVQRRGRVHLLHASSATGRVIVSDETLYAYLQGKKQRSGVLIAEAIV